METDRQTTTFYYNNSGGSTTSTSAVAVTSGLDAEYHDRLGGGWTDNYQVIDFNTDDLSYALGSEDAYLASETIAILQIIKDLGISSTLSEKLGSLFALNSLDRTFGNSDDSFNTSIVRMGATSVVFHKTFDGKWFSPQSPTAQLVDLPGGQDTGSSTYTAADGEVIYFSPYRYDQVILEPNSSSLDVTPQSPVQPLSHSIGSVKYMKADAWYFPNGVKLDFSYTGTSLSSGSNGISCSPYEATVYTGQYGYLLSSVSNNLGHSLIFHQQLYSTRHTNLNKV